MRRTAFHATIFGLPLILSGCTGFGTFLDHTFSLPGNNPNLPMTDSENVRRVLGQSPGPTPLLPESGNVWPGPERPEPTLEDIQKNPGTEDQRGFPPTTVPGAQPGAPAGRQPRPLGSSTPPGDLNDNSEVGPGPAPGTPPIPRPPTSVPGPGPLGRIIQTPSGPAVDAGGTNAYRQLTTPQGPGAIMVPNNNGTSTIINPNGTIQTVPSR
jgi:hypothetical protein